MFARLLPLKSATFLCSALVFETWVPRHVKKARKNHHRPQIHMHSLAITNTILGKHTGYFFTVSRRFLGVCRKRDHLFPTA